MAAWKTGDVGGVALSFGKLSVEKDRKADCYFGRLTG